MKLKALGAEFVGTFMLMASILGSAFYSFAAPAGAAGILGVAFAIGIVVMTMARSVGHISGGHFNPAVTIGLAAGGRFPFSMVVPYVVVQLLAAATCCGVFSVIGGGVGGNYAANGFGELSMLKVGLPGVFIIETVMTAFFLIVIMGATRPGSPAGFAPLSIGFALTAIHIMSIPVSNTSVNPARSFGPAIYAGGEPLAQLWVFFAAPILGAIIGALIYNAIETDA
ncbi:MAG: aquaporin [Deltaproteobacteria bacterium]